MARNENGHSIILSERKEGGREGGLLPLTWSILGSGYRGQDPSVHSNSSLVVGWCRQYLERDGGCKRYPKGGGGREMADIYMRGCAGSRCRS